MIRRFASLVAAGMLTVFASTASAQSCQTLGGNLVQNCSFELGDPVLNGADYPNAAVASWTSVYAPDGGTFERWTNGFDNFFAQDGHSHIELQVNGPTNIQQVLGTTAGQSYSLNFWSAGRPRGDAYSQLDVYVGGVKLMSTGQITDTYEWHQFSTTFVAASNAETLEFHSMGNGASYGDFLDNVSVEGVVNTQSVVPEPSSFALMGAGVAMLGFMSRRRRSAITVA